MELRTNSEALHAENRQAVADGLRQVTLAVATNRELADLVSGDVPWEEMTSSQRIQLGAWFTAWLKSAEEAYLQFESGVLDEGVWLARKSQAVGLLGRPHMRRVYDAATDGGTYVSEFVITMDQALAERNGE